MSLVKNKTYLGLLRNLFLSTMLILSMSIEMCKEDENAAAPDVTDTGGDDDSSDMPDDNAIPSSCDVASNIIEYYQQGAAYHNISWGQSFTVSSGTLMTSTDLLLSGDASVVSATVTVYSGGTQPGEGSMLGTATINSFSGAPDWHSFTYEEPISLTPGTTYWLEVSGIGGDFMAWDDNVIDSSGYADGSMCLDLGFGWFCGNYDLNFRINGCSN